MKLYTVSLATLLATGTVAISADAQAKIVVKGFGCDPANAIDYKSGEAACRSGNFKGQAIQECKWVTYKHNAKKKKRWEPHYSFYCSQDGSREGIYVQNCNQARTAYSTLKLACADPRYKGKVLHHCKDGKSKARRGCEGARGDAVDQRKKGIFKGSCSGAHLAGAKRLKKACKANAGWLVVECTNECVKRDGLKCVKRTWRRDVSMVCDRNSKARLTIKKCTPWYAGKLKAAFRTSRLQIKALVSQIEESLKDEHGWRTKGKLLYAKAIAKGVQRWMGRPYKIKCPVEGFLSCKAGHVANTWFGTRSFNVCNRWAGLDDKMKASNFVHEVSHKFLTLDNYYYNERFAPKKKHPWHRIASTYNYWINNGFCVPGKDCP